jgi:hypothetical protein
MQEIKPKYITFEQAELLVKKGFDEHCTKVYDVNTPESTELFDYGSMVGDDELYAPEQWQVCEWLRVNHGIWVSVTQELGATITYCYLISGEHTSSTYKAFFKSPQEAYSTAFDYILKELI